MNRAQIASPHRYRLNRAGIRNVWQYDEQEFAFGDGRLLLRGKNGAGKSKALEMLLPYLLDGDARALDATGTGRTTLPWLMLDGYQHTNRLGYLWLEFARTDEDGETHHLTLGAAIRASGSTKEAKPTFFITSLRVGGELQLAPAGQPLPVEQLKAQVGPEYHTDRAAEHRARVARTLFGLPDLPRYRNLLHLLHRLRRPTIGDRVDSGGLVQVLSETLPALNDEVVEKVARNLDDLDTVREELGRLERTDSALRTFLAGYRGYLHGALRRRLDTAGAELDALTRARRAADEAAAEVSGLRGREDELTGRLETLAGDEQDVETDLSALRDSADYRGLKELDDRRGTVSALHSAAVSAVKTLTLAHGQQQGAGQRLTEDIERRGAALVDLGTDQADLVEAAERSGFDQAHLGEACGVPTARLADSRSAEVLGPDGELHRLDHAAVGAVDYEALAGALQHWGARLEAASPVVRGRVRAARELAELFGALGRAREAARESDTARENLEGQADEAQELAARRRDTAALKGREYADAVHGWLDRLSGCSDLPMDGVRALLAQEPDEGPLSAEIPDEVTEAVRSALEPWLERLAGERDSAALAVGTVSDTLAGLRAERRMWESRVDPEPPAPAHRTAARAAGTGAPLYRLVDFAEELEPAARAGVEAALEASGLLDAWVCADGTVLDADTRDTLLVPGAPPAGPTLARVLRPVAAPGSGVTAVQVGRLLESVVLGPGGSGDDTAVSVVGVDGSWSLGIARGRHAKSTAEYVGAEVRAETRRRALAELDRQLAETSGELAAGRAHLEALTARRSQVVDVQRQAPQARELTDAWARTAEAERNAAALLARAAAAARAAADARAAEVTARREAEAAAASHGLPDTPGALEPVRTALDRLSRGVDQLRGRIGSLAASVDATGRHLSGYRDAVSARADAEDDYGRRLAELDGARRSIRRLEEALGASEQEILSRERSVQDRLRELRRQLPAARRGMDDAREARIRAESAEQAQRTELTRRQDEVLTTTGRRLRAALTRPGLVRGAGLGGPEEAAVAGETDGAGEADEPREPDGGSTVVAIPDPVHSDVRHRLTVLRRLIASVRELLDDQRGDISDSALLNRHTALRDQLSGGYDATISEEDGIKLCHLVDDHGPQDVATVGARISARAADARQRLTDRERDVFQRFLTGELGDHLSAQVLAASALVAALNTTLASARTSHGLGVVLDWKLADGAEADVKAAVDLLRSPSGLRTREESEQLRAVLQRRIEDARRADPAAGYTAHLRAALDYREWFTFTPWVVDDTRPGKRRRLSARTGLSQGEQRVLSYLVLFAAAAAHFTGLAEGAPHTPRLILLDDAFAKVDEPTHAELGRVLVTLDLDFVLTSERLIGNWPDVPSLHIYECLREQHTRGVATLHYHWNGTHRRLLPV